MAWAMVTIIDRSHSDHHVVRKKTWRLTRRALFPPVRRSDHQPIDRRGSATSGRAIGAQDTLRTARNRFVIQFFIVPDKGDSSDEKKTRRGQQIGFARSTAAEIKIAI